MSAIPTNPNDDIRRLNPHLYPAGGVSSASEPQQGNTDEPLATPKRKAADAKLVVVRVTCCRCKLLDDDNPYEKDVIDGLKHAGLLFDDSPKWANITVAQVQVKNKEDEGTVVDFTQL